jgi:hypothetical protein
MLLLIMYKIRLHNDLALFAFFSGIMAYNLIGSNIQELFIECENV